jgi:gamma-D-glutamyl-L-lysine dipeptidyl-peptidase
MDSGICLLSIIPLRKEPSERSEMVSQLLFGEGYEINEKTASWLKITTEFDRYSGWMDKKMFTPVSADYYNKLVTGAYAVAGSVVTKLADAGGIIRIIAAGSTLGHAGPDGTLEIDSELYYSVDQSLESIISRPENLISTAKRFLHAPYLWGGRSPFGYDCSGFTQMVYKINGKRLPRDAWQQEKTGDAVDRISDLKAGDLVFFAGEDRHVNHVGLAISPDQIIHCSGMVRIDKLDEKGIFNSDANQYTHRLYSMRRLRELNLKI